MIVVTGGAGFIGSAIIHELNRRGRDDILLVDSADHPEKEENIRGLAFEDILDKNTFLNSVKESNLTSIEAVVHMGACSSTTETDEDYLRENNFEYTRHLARYAVERDIRFVYASSAATYGDGKLGYADDESGLESLKPLNLYGESKQHFDLWAKRENMLGRIVGLKYFNVYGPNEYHKGSMQSLVRKGFFQVRDTGKIRLFKSYKSGYGDGEQVRDFIYIKDAVEMTLFFLDHPEVHGIFNIGAGEPRSWNDLAEAIFSALEKEPHIEYIDMPDSIRDQYQYHTCAEMKKLHDAGFSGKAFSLETGIRDYVHKYLLENKRFGR